MTFKDLFSCWETPMSYVAHWTPLQNSHQ